MKRKPANSHKHLKKHAGSAPVYVAGVHSFVGWFVYWILIHLRSNPSQFALTGKQSIP
jgi:hypothetical protein